MIRNTMLEFLIELQMNNNLDWMKEHRSLKDKATNEFTALVQEIIYKIAVYDQRFVDSDASKLIFRLNRDTRFSHDKSPYNPTFRAHISPEGKSFIPVAYYIHIGLDNNSFLGGGMFGTQFPEATTLIREYILKHSSEFIKIIEEPTFKKNFVVLGEKLKNLPRGYESTSMDSFIKHKSWYLQYDFTNEQLDNQKAFIDFAIEKFMIMKPFNDYINKALINFKIPVRK